MGALLIAFKWPIAVVGVVGLALLLLRGAITRLVDRVHQTLGSLHRTADKLRLQHQILGRIADDLQLRADQEVRVFRFASESEATAVVGAISPDGYSVGASGGLTTISQVDWVAKPHFYRSGSLIILYVGDDAAIRQLLSAAVGPPFAGGA